MRRLVEMEEMALQLSTTIDNLINGKVDFVVLSVAVNDFHIFD